MILSIVEERIYFTFGAFPKIEMRKYDMANKIWQTNKSDIHIHIQDFCGNKQEKSQQTQNIDVTDDGELEKISGFL